MDVPDSDSESNDSEVDDWESNLELDSASIPMGLMAASIPRRDAVTYESVAPDQLVYIADDVEIVRFYSISTLQMVLRHDARNPYTRRC